MLFVTGYLAGIVTIVVKAAMSNKQAYLKHCFELIKNNEDLREHLGISAIVFRRGVDGTTAMPQEEGKSWKWQMLLCIVGEDNNTPEGRREFAGTIMDFFNENATKENYEHPKQCRFGGDLTATPMEPADMGMLDEDVLGLILAAYPEHSISELMAFDDVIGMFWSDVEHGKSVLQAHEANMMGP